MTLPLPAPPDYTDRDYAALRARLQTLITAAFPDWEDFERSRFENVLLDEFCYTEDVLSFYLDQMAKETRWGTAQLRVSMIELAKLVDYQLDTQSAGLTDIVFSIPVVTAGNVVVPIGTTVKTKGFTNVTRYQSLAIATIPAGLLVAPDVSSENSRSESDSFTATGEQGEPFVISQKPFLDGTESMTIGAVPWTRVDDFLDSTPADLHYTVRVDSDDVATMKLGGVDNLGAQAAPGAAVIIDYKAGGGDAGNVDANALEKVEGGPFYDDLGNRVNLSVNNALAAVGGLDRESVEQARRRAPRSLRVLTRTVARTDWEDLAIQVDGVSRALALSRNQLVSIPEGQVWVWVVPSALGNPSGALITEIESFINDNYPTSVIVTWEVRTVTTYVTVDIVSTVYLTENAVEADVATLVRAGLTNWFAPLIDDNGEASIDGDINTNVDWGFNQKDASGTPDGLVVLSDIKNVIRDTTSVRKLGTPDDAEGTTLNGNEDDVTVAIQYFSETGNLQLINGDTALDIYNGPI